MNKHLVKKVIQKIIGFIFIVVPFAVFLWLVSPEHNLETFLMAVAFVVSFIAAILLLLFGIILLASD